MAEGNIYNMSQRELMEALTPPEPEDKGFLGNLFTRRFLNPMQERLGMRESLADQMRREQIGASRLDAFQDLQGMQRDQQLRQQLIAAGVDPNTANSLPIDKVADALVARSAQSSTNVYGDLVTSNPLTGAQQVLSTAPTSVREYNFSRSQTQPPIAPQAYDDFIAQRRRSEESKPSVVKTYEYLAQLNPAIRNLPAQEQQDLLFKIIRQDPETAAEIAKKQQMMADGGVFLTPAERAVDEAFGKDFAAYNALGGASTGRKNMKELTEIIGILSAPSNQETITGRAVSLMPEVTRPDLTLDVQNRVERIITEDLRATLGAQFTENEAKAFISRSFNLALPESVNADRLRRLRAAMSQAHKAKEDAGKYYTKSGTVKGFDNFKDIASFETAMYKVEDYRGFTNEEIDEMLQLGIEQQSPISRAEYDILLKVAEARGL